MKYHRADLACLKKSYEQKLGCGFRTQTAELSQQGSRLKAKSVKKLTLKLKIELSE